jgi:NADH dehydrogenase/NADH:ubiquinone oxidoreductase subunit G
LTIDGTEVTVPKGTLIIRAAEQVGVEIPRFCDHPYLEPAGACRQCYVQIEAAEAGDLLHRHRRPGHGGEHATRTTRCDRRRWRTSSSSS